MMKLRFLTLLLIMLLVAACGGADEPLVTEPESGTLSQSDGGDSAETDASIPNAPDAIEGAQNDAGIGGDAGDTVATALRVASGQVVQAVSSGETEQDCFTVSMPTDDGVVRVALTTPADQFVRAELWAEDETLLTSGTMFDTNELALAFGDASYEAAAAGDYTVCVAGVTFDAETEYALTMTVEDAVSNGDAADARQSDESGDLADVCGLLSAKTIQQTLDISTPIIVGVDSGVAIGDFLGICQYTWDSSQHFVKVTLQEDEEREMFTRIVGMASDGGLVEVYDGVGDASVIRMDGSLSWVSGDDVIFTLFGQFGSFDNLIPAEQLAELANIIIANR